MQVFKYFSNAVTEDGLMTMLRVIKEKSVKLPRHPGAENKDKEDDNLIDIEDEEIDEDEMGETAESDGQPDDSEALVAAEEMGDDHSEASDDGMDDDAMFRMDPFIEKAIKEKKNQTGVETGHSQLVLFKLRILSLLEIFLHENPGKYRLHILLMYGVPTVYIH